MFMTRRFEYAKRKQNCFENAAPFCPKNNGVKPSGKWVPPAQTPPVHLLNNG